MRLDVFTRLCRSVFSSYTSVVWSILMVARAQQRIDLDFPAIVEVSAMCTEEGITAKIMFDDMFHGKIYSNRYANVHDCVYYNVFDMNMVVFTIPNYKCGTRLTRNTQNVVNHIENEVYVQFDKDTQNVEDRRYLFVCDLAPSIDFSITVNPSQTVIIQTIEPTHIQITQEGGAVQPNVFMQIRDGDGPFQPAVTRSLKLGDVLTLTVTGRQVSTGGQFNMFVHSCFATDGSGAQRIELIDRSGCSAKQRIAGQMQRLQASGDTIYHFRLIAFKFPGSEDVYFSCSVDICAQCNFADICPNRAKRSPVADIGFSTKNLTSQPLRSSFSGPEINAIQLHDYVKIESAERAQAYQANQQPFCFTLTAMVCLMATFGCTLLALIGMTVFVISIVHRRRRDDKCSEHRRVLRWGALRHWNRNPWTFSPTATTTSSRQTMSSAS